jgi:predicted enzyme related to lactoylglutathione lyase
MTDPRPCWGGVTVDCQDPERLAAFWAEMLDTSVRARWQQYVSLHTPPGTPGLAFQRVRGKASGKNALHLDVHVKDEIDVEPLVEHALALGGQLHARVQQDDTAWVVLLDPEGNQFCVVAAGPQYE